MKLEQQQRCTIVPSSVEAEDQTNPICVNKLALARAYIENVTAGKLPRLEEFTNKQQFNRVITDLLTGITGIPKSQSEQLSVDLHKNTKECGPNKRVHCMVQQPASAKYKT